MAIKAKIKWTDDLQFVATTEKGPAVVMDVPDGGTGPSPMEMLLFGVAGCTAVDVVSILKKKRLNLADFFIDITGERAEKEPKRFTKIRIEYHIVGKGITEKAVEQAIELSETKYCSAMASVNAEFESTYTITEPET